MMTNINTTAMPEEASNTIKQLMFEGFYSHFTAMMNTIRKLPLAPHMLQIIVKEFDNGLLWTKEAFNGMVIPAAPQPPMAPANDMKVIESPVITDELIDAA